MSTTIESDWENTRLKERIEQLEAERDQLREHVKILREWMLNNSQHTDNCDVLCLDENEAHMECSCGLSKALAATEPTAGGAS